MAYSPADKYPTAVDSDPNYKGGKFRDNNPSTTNNGSPLKAIDRNELLARDEAIMNDAGFDYNSLPDTPQDSQLFKAYKASLGNGANLLSNHNFLIPSPDDSQPAPSSTPTSYPPGYEIFSGVFANETTGISNLTYIDGRVSFSGGDLYFAVSNTGGLERLNADQFVASVADFDGKPRTRGVSFGLVGDEYRATVGIDALSDGVDDTPLGSVKFEQGKVATGHDVQSAKGQIYNFDSIAQAVANCPPVGSSVSVDDYYGGANPNNSGVLFFKVVPAGTGAADGGKYIDVDSTKQLEQNVRFPVQASAWGCSTYISDNSAPINSALNYASEVYIGGGEFDILDNVKIPLSKNLTGYSKLETVLNIRADVVGVTLLALSALRNIRVTGKDGLSTKNNIEVGSPTESGARSIIENVYSDRAGNDGIQVRDGNLGTLRDVHSIFNTRDGVNFTTETADNNNWTFEGYNDWRDNGRDGLHLGQGSSVFDVLAPKSHVGWFSVQNNTRYGAYIGTRSNVFTVYSENNGSDEVLLDTYGVGNDITTVEGAVTDVTGLSQVSQANVTGNGVRRNTQKLRLSGVTGKGLEVGNDDGTAGVLNLEKTSVRNFKLSTTGSSSNQFLTLTNEASGAELELICGGKARPEVDNLYSLGQSSARWSEVFATNGTINTSDERLKTPLVGITEAEKACALEIKANIFKYQMLDAVEKKGSDKARIHFGVGAQTVKSIFDKYGLDASDYSLFCYDEWDDDYTEKIITPATYGSDGKVDNEAVTEQLLTTKAGNRYGIRYDQLSMFILSAI